MQPCILVENSKELKNLENLVKILNEKMGSASHLFFKITNIYFDLGQEWMYTAILTHDTKTGDAYHTLNPAQWEKAVEGKNLEELAIDILKNTRKYYKIPVEWEVTGDILILAKNIEEAIKIADKKLLEDDIEIPEDSIIIEGSLKRSSIENTVIDVEWYKAMNGMSIPFTRLKKYFKRKQTINYIYGENAVSDEEGLDRTDIELLRDALDLQQGDAVVSIDTIVTNFRETLYDDLKFFFEISREDFNKILTNKDVTF